eukprot:SAG22_NODE_13823_length_393_cov_78.993197_1_plen_53_part_10
MKYTKLHVYTYKTVIVYIHMPDELAVRSKSYTVDRSARMHRNSACLNSSTDIY